MKSKVDKSSLNVAFNSVKLKTRMKRILSLSVFVFVFSLLGVSSVFAKGGFNEFGYNYGARIFSGLADGVDKNLDDAVWGDPKYANDHVVMKWNKAWDLCNANDYDDPAFCLGAWTDNEWNGKVAGGSGEVWHYKIVWVGPKAENSPYWKEGGYSVWNNYEVVMDQGTFEGLHTWLAHAVPNGYGVK